MSISLIAQHGGTLKLQSELGRGTTATFDLRLLDMEAANDD